jgi:tagatose-1,6-bisphosphate aldolase
MVTVIKKKTPKNRLKAAVKRARQVRPKGFDAAKHLGKWKLDEDSLATQKRLRDEWA